MPQSGSQGTCLGRGRLLRSRSGVGSVGAGRRLCACLLTVARPRAGLRAPGSLSVNFVKALPPAQSFSTAWEQHGLFPRESRPWADPLSVPGDRRRTIRLCLSLLGCAPILGEAC